jgi:polar amino acid transport system substrate-binding protein
MLKRTLISLGLLCCLAFQSVAHADLPDYYQVTLLTENLPPFNMAASGRNFAREKDLTGISTELVREMFKRAGIRYNLSLRFPWDRMYNLVLEKPDYAIFSTTRTPEREGLFKWVGPLVQNEWVLLAPADSTITVADLQAAAKYRIGAYKNDAVSQYLESQGLAPINALRDQENIPKLEKGQIDLWATSNPGGPYLAKQAGVTNLKVVLRFKTVELYLAFNPHSSDEAIQRLQKALDGMSHDGFVASVKDRY